MASESVEWAHFMLQEPTREARTNETRLLIKCLLVTQGVSTARPFCFYLYTRRSTKFSEP